MRNVHVFGHKHRSMKKLATLLLALGAVLVFHSCNWINKDEPAEASDERSNPAAPIAAVNVVTYSGTASDAAWQSFYFPFKKPFQGDIRIKHLTIKFSDGADASQSFYLGNVELRNFPAGTTMDDPKPEKAINITRAGTHVDIVFKEAKFSGTVHGDKIEGEFESKATFNESNTNSKVVYVTAPITLYKQ